MSDEPQGDQVEQKPTAADDGVGATSPSRTFDDSTQELPAVTGPVVDDEMLAAFEGTAEPAVVAVEDAAVVEAIEIDDDAETDDDDATDVPEVIAGAEDVAAEASEEASEPAPVVVEPAPVVVEPAPVITPTGSPDGPVSHAAPRRSTWPLVFTTVGVILALIAVGAAGVYVGRETAPAPSVVVQNEATATETAASPSMAVGPLPVPAPGTFLITTARVPTATWPVMLNSTASLPDDAGTAPGYRLVNAGISGAQVAGILSTSFGASGSAVETDTGWEVGNADEPHVTVKRDPLFSWLYEDPAALALPPVDPPLDPAEAISGSTDALAGIGVDISTVEYDISTVDGRTGVNAWQMVGEQRTQLGWSLTFDTDGTILRASGFSSGLEGVPDYPVVGAATAIARSQQSPWTALPASPITGPTDGTEDAPVPAPNASGVPAVDVPMSTVDVTSAELGLAQYWQPDGSILLLPSYILTGADGSTWSLLAVAETAVSFVNQPFPAGAAVDGFIAEPFPSSDAAEDVTDASVTGDELPVDSGAEDVGVVDENGDTVFDPASDPATAE